MNFKVQLIAFYTIIRREISRVFRIWVQSLLGPIVNIFLYFLIFGNVVGRRIGDINGIPYLEFIAPALIMLTAINSTYSNISSSFFLTRFQKNIEDMIVSPISNCTILLGFALSSMIRGLLVAIILDLVIYVFFNVNIRPNISLTIDLILSTALFALIGFLNGLKARNFDDIMLVPSFILTPLGYLGGIFFTISMLPEKWQNIAKLNPLMYIIETFRMHALNLQAPHGATTYEIIILISLSLLFFILKQMKNNMLLEPYS
jgi:ABC-2 type transport system permease protein